MKLGESREIYLPRQNKLALSLYTFTAKETMLRKEDISFPAQVNFISVTDENKRRNLK